jgi:hypothetical protein
MHRLHLTFGVVWLIITQRGLEFPDLSSVAPDLTTPPMITGIPVPGRRVRQVAPGYEGAGVYHALYLPEDWQPGRRYPVIVEYAGNGPYRSEYGDFSPGTVEGSNLGYGISGGKGFIWVCMPYVNTTDKRNQLWWWGDVQATVDYCKRVVRSVCERYGGDSGAVILAGFSRGAIACNYIGLHDDAIADTWLAFVAYSHYDGVRTWDYPASDRASALERLRRVKGRAVFICRENSVQETREYVAATRVQASFTFVTIPFRNHNDAWALRDISERRELRSWLRDVLVKRPGTHRISGRITDESGKGAPSALIESGDTHLAITDRSGRYALEGLANSYRTVKASKQGFVSRAVEVSVAGRDITGIDIALRRDEQREQTSNK